MFIINIFDKCKDSIFEDVYNLLIDGYFNDIHLMEEYIYEAFESWYMYYSEINPLIRTNNDIIYKYVVKRLSNILILNNNFYELENTITDEIIDQELVTFDDDNKFDTFTNIIHSVLKSFYIKNFYRTKSELLNKQKLTITDKKFIKQVKRDECLFNSKDYVNYRTKIVKYLKKNPTMKMELKTNFNYVSRTVYKFISKEKLPADVVCSIIKKTYESYTSHKALRAKGKKANIPKFLPFDGKYIFPVFPRSFRDVEINGNHYMKLTVGKYVAENFNTIISNDNYICLNSDKKTVNKLYVHKTHLIDLKPGMKHTKEIHVHKKKYIKRLDENIFNANFIYIRKPDYISDNRVNLVEINPLYDGFVFKANIIL